MKRYMDRLDKVTIAIVLLFLFSLGIGILIADDYGLSWDEYKDLSYGEVALTAYEGSEDFLWEGGNRKIYGPAYWMLVGLISNFVNSLPFDVQIIYVWKITNFITFQLGVLAFYYLAKRFITRIPAVFTTALFMTQPLLWGHAFINPKDIPFMSFFLISMVLSLKGFDAFHHYTRINDDLHDEGQKRVVEKWLSLRQNWKGTSSSQKAIMAFLLLLFVIVTIELLHLKSFLLPLMQTVVRDAYHGESIHLINSMFERIAQDAYKTQLDLYLGKISILYNWIRWIIIFGLAFVGYFTYRRFLFGSTQKFDWQNFRRRLSYFIIPGIFLGLTISIRVVGIFIGVLFSVYFLYKARGKAILPLIFYWGIAAGITIATWPYLWNSVVTRLLKSIEIVGKFSTHETLFQGQIHLSEEMPLHYLPFLIIIQLTEPAILLFLIGIPLCVKLLRKKAVDLAEILLISGWIGGPLLAEIVLRVPIYDNFRQFLFILPPLFLFIGFGVSWIWQKLNRYRIGAVVLGILLLPGIVAMFKLHPYEYVYYNTLVGGTGSVYGEYELDYWCTSLREAMEFLNENAAPNSYVYISGPVTAAEPFARVDLKVKYGRPVTQTSGYVVGCRYEPMLDDFFPDSEIIYEVGIDEGIFTTIKKMGSEP